MFKSKAKRLFGGGKQSPQNRQQQQNQSQNGQQQLELEPTTMIVAKQEYLDFKQCHRTYSCAHCRAHLADHDQLISKLFQGNHGRAYLFNQVLNVGCKQAVQRELLTGLHAVADIYCDNCETTLGWKYEQAFVPSQKYKEGKYIIELVHMLKENNWDLTSYNAREFIREARLELANSVDNYNNNNDYYDINSYYHSYKNHYHNNNNNNNNHNSFTSPTIMVPITGAIKDEVLDLATTRLSPGNDQHHNGRHSVIIDTECTNGGTRLIVGRQQDQHETNDNPNQQQLMTTTDDETHTITTTKTTSMKQNPPQEADEFTQGNAESNNNNNNNNNSNNNSEMGTTTSIIDITNIIEKRGVPQVADPMELIEKSLANLIVIGDGCNATPLAGAIDAAAAAAAATSINDNTSDSSTSDDLLCSSSTNSQHESELCSDPNTRIVIVNGDEVDNRIPIYNSSSSSDSSLHFSGVS